MKSKWRTLSGLVAASLAVMLVAGCQTSQRSTLTQNPGIENDTLDRGFEPTPSLPEALVPTTLPAEGVSAKGTSSLRTHLVTVTKTGPVQATVGDEFCYDIVVKADQDIANLVLTDQVPAGATYVRSEPPAQSAGGLLTWKVPSMNKGETKTMRVCFKADKEGELTSCFTVTADPRACVTIIIGKPALAVTKTGPQTAQLGADITYTIVVSNTGNSIARDVVVTDVPGDGLEARMERERYTANIGDLGPGQSRTIPVMFKGTKRGRVCNVVNVTSSNAGRVSAEACTLISQPGLKVEKTGEKQKFLGQRASYKVVVKNIGDTDLTNVIVTDEAPAQTSLVSATGANVSGNTAVWTVPSLKAGEEKSFDVVLTSRTPGTHCNRVTAASGVLRDAAEACTEWRGVSAVLVELVDEPDPLAVGETTTFTVRVTNQGTDDVDQIDVSAALPAGLDPVSASSGGSISGKGIKWPQFPALAPKQVLTYTFVGRATAIGDQRTRIDVTTRSRQQPIEEQESTTVY